MNGITMGTMTERLSGHAVVIPANEAWIHTPEMQRRLTAAQEWADRTLRQATDLDALDRAYAARRAALRGTHDRA